jgi:hypothetical protein
MPLVVELGVAFDVLVAMVLFGVFFFQIRDSIDSLDVDRLNRLSEIRDGRREGDRRMNALLLTLLAPLFGAVLLAWCAPMPCWPAG